MTQSLPAINMIRATPLNDCFYDVCLNSTGACLGVFSRQRTEEFNYFPIQRDYNTSWSAELLIAIGEKLKEVNGTRKKPMETDKINHADMVRGLVKDGADIIAKLTPTDAHVWHMASGVSGEAGELLDAVKKAVIYRKDIDRANVIEELGDLEFYLEGIRQGFGITRDETIEANIQKLGTRYKGFKYTDQAAIDRADKQ